MKIAHIADSHFKKDRLDECIRCFDHIISYLEGQKPDWIFHAGDLFDKNVLINSLEYRAAVEAMISLANIAPVIMVRGNHDPVYALDIFEKLKTNNFIYYFDDIEVVQNDDFNLLTIPYQRPSDIGSGDEIGDIHKSGADLIRSRIKEFIKESDRPNLILAHISILDSRFANSERIQEGEIIMSVESFDVSGIDGVFLGHIHNSQQDIFNGTRIRYAGSHYRTRFDEVMEPGFYMWEFNGETSIGFVNTPARNMVQINLGEEDTKRLIAKGDFTFPEGDVKLVLEVPQGMNQIVDTSDIMNLVSGGTNLNISIKVNPITEVRSKKMSEGLTDQEKLNEWGSVSEVNITSSIKKKFDEIINHDIGIYT